MSPSHYFNLLQCTYFPFCNLYCVVQHENNCPSKT